MFFYVDPTSSGILIHFLPWQNLVVSSMTFSNPSHTLFEGLGLGKGMQERLEEIEQEQTYSPLGLLPCTALEYELFPLGPLNYHVWVHEGLGFQTHNFICHDWGCKSVIPQSSEPDTLWRMRERNEIEDPWFFLYHCRKKQSQSRPKRQSSRLCIPGSLTHCKCGLETSKKLAFWNFRL